ncbi:MAG: ribosome maturation factor RimM [Kineosporiaceae bacterium]
MRLLVARVGRAHGIRGEVTVQVHTDDPEARFAPGSVLLPAAAGPGLPAALTVTATRDHNGVRLLTFAEIADRTAAEALRGVRLEVDVAEAEADSEDDAWYDHDLIGLHAVDPAGHPVGRVVGVEHLPAQDLLEVEVTGGERRLVPLVTAIVPEVDIAGGRVVIDAPPGLLSDLDDD